MGVPGIGLPRLHFTLRALPLSFKLFEIFTAQRRPTMMTRRVAATCAFGVIAAVAALTGAGGPPQWAYGTPVEGAPAPAAAPAAPEDGAKKHLAGSSGEFTLTEVRNGFGPADWYPGDHPTMPEVVAHGRRPDIRACGLCHYPNGKGRSENAGVAGLPVAYFVQQMTDFRSGARKSADPKKANTNAMIAIAKAMTDDEIKATAEYFGSMKWTPWVKVVETATVPKTRIAGGLFLKLDGKDTEPIGQRIIEVPDNTESTELLRDPHSGFTAYAPIGSIKKGEALVTNGAGRTTACGICHGVDLKGLGPVPGIAGRSPSYLARQLYDMQQGTRNGLWTDLMKPVVAKLTEEDLVSIGAYTASRTP
jgi:cytochrome c553